MDEEIFCLHFAFQKLLTLFYCFEFLVHKIKSIWIHESSRTIRNNRMGETLSTFYLDSQIIFHRNTHRIRGEFNKNTGRMQNSLWILEKNLVCNDNCLSLIKKYFQKPFFGRQNKDNQEKLNHKKIFCMWLYYDLYLIFLTWITIVYPWKKIILPELA